MIFNETTINGVFLIELPLFQDNRGTFTRLFCAEEFSRHGLVNQFTQHSLCYNQLKGTLRGLHFQAAPHAEDKLIKCISGRLFDVILDIRNDSATYGKIATFELSANIPQILYVSKGCAHGYVTLEDKTELLYEMSVPYNKKSVRGFAWDSTKLSIPWPISNPIISEKDRNLPMFDHGMSA